MDTDSSNTKKGDRVKTRTVYRKKRKGFMGDKGDKGKNNDEGQSTSETHQATTGIANNDTSTPTVNKCKQSVSASKLVDIPDVTTPKKDNGIYDSRIIDCSMLLCCIARIAMKLPLNYQKIFQKGKGLLHYLL